MYVCDPVLKFKTTGLVVNKEKRAYRIVDKLVELEVTGYFVRKTHKFHSSQIQIVQELSEGDCDCGLEFCETMNQMIIENPNLIKTCILMINAHFP